MFFFLIILGMLKIVMSAALKNDPSCSRSTPGFFQGLGLFDYDNISDGHLEARSTSEPDIQTKSLSEVFPNHLLRKD
jgi:hypothetical protein